MQRDQAKKLMEQTIPNKNLQKHMLACEACMRALAARFGEDVEAWGLAGLLHDLDYDQTVSDFGNHGRITAKMLEGTDVPAVIIHAIQAHPGHVAAESTMDFALYAVDPITGLIVAAALMHPTKKLASVDVGFVMKRYKEKRFAAGANREQIATCDRLGLGLEDFTGACLAAMQGISGELGL